MRKFVLTLLLASTTLAGCTNLRTTSLSTADINAITGLRLALIEAIESGDAITYGDLCIDDVQLLHSGAPIITGRADLVKHNAAMFRAVKVINLELTPLEIYGARDVAYEVGTQKLSIEPTLEGFSSSRKYVHVMRRSAEGHWRFAALISNDS